jgi:hypothetical protein
VRVLRLTICRALPLAIAFHLALILMRTVAHLLALPLTEATMRQPFLQFDRTILPMILGDLPFCGARFRAFNIRMITREGGRHARGWRAAVSKHPAQASMATATAPRTATALIRR